MAVKKTKLRQKTPAGFDDVLLASRSDICTRPDGSTVEASLNQIEDTLDNLDGGSAPGVIVSTNQPADATQKEGDYWYQTIS